MMPISSFEHALKISLEDEVEEKGDGEVLQEISDIVSKSPSEGRSAEIVNAQVEGGCLAQALSDIAEAASASATEGNNVMSAESLEFTLQTLLRSRMMPVTGCSFENISDPAARLEAIKDTSSSRALRLRHALRASCESSYGDLEEDIYETVDELSKAKGTLGQAINKIKAREHMLDASPIALNHAEFYRFLMINDQPVRSLATVMDRDKLTLKKMIAASDKFNKVYSDLADKARGIKGNDLSELNGFLAELVGIDPGELVGQFDGTYVLNNGTLRWYRPTADAYGDDAPMQTYHILDCKYRSAPGDGSVLSNSEKNKNSRSGGIGTAIVGGIFGLVIGGAVGAAVGAVAGGVLGATAGRNSSHTAVQGRNTYSHSSVRDVIEFMKDAQEICDLARTLKDSMKRVETNAAKVDTYFNMFSELVDVKRDAAADWADLASNMATVMLKADVTIARSSGNDRVTKIQSLVRHRMDGLYAAHASLCETAAQHAWRCATTSLKVADAIIRTTHS